MRTIILFCFLCCSTAGQSQEMHLGTSKDKIEEYYIISAKHNNEDVAIDVWDRIKPADGQLANFRKKVIAEREKAKASTDGFEKLGYYKRKIQYRCKSKTYRVMECEYYDTSGKQLDSTDSDDNTKWDKVPSSTIREDEFKQVCK